MLTKLLVSPETSVISADCPALDFDAHIYRYILKRKMMTLAETLLAIAVTSETWLVEPPIMPTMDGKLWNQFVSRQDTENWRA